MRILHHLCVLLLLAAPACATSAARAQDEDQERFVVIKAGRVITLAGPEQRRAEIVLLNDKIRLVGTELEYPKTAKVIDATDEVVMPGMILPRTRWRLPSYSRSGVHGDRSVTQELYLDEVDFQPLLEAGFTALCFYPAGTGIPGPAAVYRTAGKKKDRNLGAAYLRVTMSSPSRDKKVLRGAIAKARQEIEKVEKARKAWEEKQKKAKAEAAKKAKEEADKKKQGEQPDKEKKNEPGKDQDDKKQTPEKKETKDKPGTEKKKEPEKFVPPKIDPAVKPLVDWIRDKKGPPLLFELGGASDFRHLQDALKPSPEIPYTLFYLGRTSSADFHHVVADLGQRKAVVLLSTLLGQLPYTATRYNLPAELAAAGCTPVLDASTGLGYVRSRLANLVRAGLPRDEALKAVTLNAAKLLGVQDRLGSIKKGKDADLIFLDGDPLAAETRVTRVMIGGEIVWEAPKQP